MITICQAFRETIRAPAAMARQYLSTVAKNLNSTEHFVNLNPDYCKLNKAAFFKYVDLSSINIKISLSLPEPITIQHQLRYQDNNLS